MIVTELKPIEEIKGFLTGHKPVLVSGCGTCVTICLAGSEREASTLASAQRPQPNSRRRAKRIFQGRCSTIKAIDGMREGGDGNPDEVKA